MDSLGSSTTSNRRQRRRAPPLLAFRFPYWKLRGDVEALELLPALLPTLRPTSKLQTIDNSCTFLAWHIHHMPNTQTCYLNFNTIFGHVIINVTSNSANRNHPHIQSCFLFKLVTTLCKFSCSYLNDL